MRYRCSFKETAQLSYLGEGNTSHVCHSHLVGPWALLYPSAWALVSQTNWQETTMLRGSDWQQTMKAHSGWDLAACVFTLEFIGSDTSCLAGRLHCRFGISLSFPNAAFVVWHPVFKGGGGQQQYTYTLYYESEFDEHTWKINRE